MATLFKRGDTWWVRFQSNGVQVRRSTRTRRKVEALAIMRRMIEEHERERRQPPSNRYRLSQAFDRFFRETSVKKGTRRTYASNRRNWTRLYPEIHIDEIDRRVLTDFISARKREKVTDTTIRRDLAFLGSVLSTAISWEWLDTNPVTSLSKRTLRESRPRTRFLTRAEFQRLCAAASPDLKPVLVLAVETGMRKEEMLGLPVCNIDLRRREVHLEDTKTNTPRRVPLSDQAVETIATILSNPSRPPSSYLFCKPDGSRILCNKKGFRTTPALLGLYSLIALWACDLLGPASTPHGAAWYRKQALTFTDAIGAVRFALWVGDLYRHSPTHRESPEIPPDRLKRMAEALCFAA